MYLKRCAYSQLKTLCYDCLVVLRKPETNFKSNESRSMIINKNFAKFRCNGLITVAIYDLIFNKFIDSLVHKTYFKGLSILYSVQNHIILMKILK